MNKYAIKIRINLPVFFYTQFLPKLRIIGNRELKKKLMQFTTLASVSLCLGHFLQNV